MDINHNIAMVALTKPGVYSLNTTGLKPPLLVKGGGLFSYSETGTGTDNIDPITDQITNQIYQAQGTNPTAQWGSLTPLQISPAQLASAISQVNLAYQQPFAASKIKPGFNFFTTKYNLSSSYHKFLTETTFGGFGTLTNTASMTFGGVSFSASFNAIPSATGSVASGLVGNCRSLIH